MIRVKEDFESKSSRQIVREILPFYHEYAIYGGYPRVVLTDDREEKTVVLKNIYNLRALREWNNMFRAENLMDLRTAVTGTEFNSYTVKVL